MGAFLFLWAVVCLARLGRFSGASDRDHRCSNVWPRRHVLMTQRRSGSGFFVSMLSSHSAVETGGELLTVQDSPRAKWEVLDAWFRRWNKASVVETTEYLWTLKGMGGNGLEHVGNRTTVPNATLFKAMISEHAGNNAELFRKLDRECAHVFFLWRRNVLRMLVSDVANRADKRSANAKHDHSHEAHPADHDTLSRMRDDRITLLTGDELITKLENILQPRQASVRAWQKIFLKHHQNTLLPLEVYYEDLIKTSATCDESWTQIQRFLQLEPQNLTTDLLQIHDEAETPLNYTILNYEAVAETLRHTPLAYTLDS